MLAECAAAGVGLFATTTTLVAALLQNNVQLAMAVVPLAGALLGFLRGQPVFQGDRGHVHHRLLDRGLTPRRVARRMLLGGVFQNMINGQVVLKSFEQRLAAAESVEECWQVLVDAGRDLGFHRVELYVAGRRFSEQLEEANGRGTWELRVPLGTEDYVHLTREFENGVQNSVVIPFVETLRGRLGAKEFPRVAAVGR